jgi:triacylglycerol lipase
MRFEHSWQALLRPGDGKRFFPLRPLPAFRAQTVEFDEGNAWWLAEMSRLMYRGNATSPSAGGPSRTAILQSVRIRVVASGQRGDACWSLNGMEGSPPCAALVFRGTSGFENWLANLKIVQSAWQTGGQVHTGFKALFMEMQAEIQEAVSQVQGPLFYAGHSLGGALALLAASLWPPHAVYTFGAPRVGDSVFRERLAKQRIFRVVNQRDIVATVPPSRIPFEFRHVGDVVSFSPPPDPGSMAVAGDGENVALHRGLLTQPPRFLSEHAPINYSAGLARLVTEGPSGDGRPGVRGIGL